MFTGIVEEVGTVRDVRRGGTSARLCVSAPVVSEGTRIGDSVSVSGVCLTVVAVDGPALTFDAVPETLRRSTLHAVSPGDPVNLERALPVSGRLGGHIVQGHVDGAGTLVSVTTVDNARVMRVALAAELLRYVATKGSIALDGISLTVAELDDAGFTVWIIPHTWEHTALRTKRAGAKLNVEVDLLARYVERLLAGESRGSGVDLDRLAQAGFLEGV